MRLDETQYNELFTSLFDGDFDRKAFRVRVRLLEPRVTASDKTINRHLEALCDQQVSPPIKRAGHIGQCKLYRLSAHVRDQILAQYWQELHGDVPSEGIRRRRWLGTMLDPDAIQDVIPVGTSTAKRQEFRGRVRQVTDWFPRRPMKLDEDIVKCCLEALTLRQRLRLTSPGHAHYTDGFTDREYSPQAMIAKDSTIYLLATREPSTAAMLPERIALHRVTKAERIEGKLCTEDRAFDVDAYLEKSHQFSHPEFPGQPDVDLELEVHRQVAYHFIEHEILGQRSLEKLEGEGKENWYLLKARLPVTRLLVPFLLSMGSWVKVIQPDLVRRELIWRTRRTAALYADEAGPTIDDPRPWEQPHMLE